MLHKRKWWLRSLIVVCALFFIAGCTNNDGAADNEQEETPAGEKNNKNTENTAEQDSSITGLEADTDLETEMEQDPGIDDVMIQVIEGDQAAVNVDIQINNEQQLSADELIEKYSGAIKEKYPDRKIDILIAQEGQIVKQTTIE